MQAARGVVALLLCLAWLSGIAAQTCIPDGTEGQGSGAEALVVTHLARDENGQCCTIALEGVQQPLPVKRPSPTDPKVQGLPPSNVAVRLETVRGVSGLSVGRFETPGHPPFYLLYRRLLIPAFL